MAKAMISSRKKVTNTAAQSGAVMGLGCDIVRVSRFFSWIESRARIARFFTASEIALLNISFDSNCDGHSSNKPEKKSAKKSSDKSATRAPSTSLSPERMQRAAEQLAGMFAAKESYKKAVGAHYAKTIMMKDIIIEKHANGAPRFRLERSAAKALAACSGTYALLSVSHEKEYAMAQTIIGASHA